MIAKRIELRNANASSFAKLVAYITSGQEKRERVGEIRITNCQSDHPSWAAMEVASVQSRNTRTRMDKTYHLLVSFREGDRPSAEAIRAIEDRICEQLGYKDHQRVSAVHDDTDHLHLHIAINKIHPKRLTAHEPYYDKKTLGRLCEQLEKDYGLAADNHIPRLTQGEAKAQDMEKSAGIESLIGWVKRGCLPELLKATSWEELHRILAKNSLTIEQRGNGLVIKDAQGIAAKASSFSRELSQNRLEKKLGAFRPCHQSRQASPIRRYEPKPMPSRIDTKQLWELYQQEKRERHQRHAVLKQRAVERKERRIANARQNAAAKRVTIGLARGRLARHLLHKRLSESFLHELGAIRRDYRQDRQAIYHKGKHAVWYDWLKAKAWEGNTQALAVLRHRYERTPVLRTNAISGTEAIDRINYCAGARIEAVTRRGTLHYQIAQAVLRDDGRVFRLAEKVGNETVETALKLAKERYGTVLSVTGTDEFREQAIAAGSRLPITFADPEMEEQRKRLSQSADTPKPDASERYIAERHAKRQRGMDDILPHRHYAAGDAGEHSFAGLRHIEGKTLMLLKTPTEMLVLPLEGYAIQRAQRLSIGDSVAVNAQGIAKSRARKV